MRGGIQGELILNYYVSNSMRTIAVIAWLLSNSFLLAQELIPNGGFEEHTKCPKDWGHFYAENWTRIGSNTTPDLISSCSPENSNVHPSNDIIGTEPYKGTSAMGMVVYSDDGSYREHVICMLNEQLEDDSTYVFCIALSIPYLSRWKITAFDVLLSEKYILQLKNAPLAEEPSFTINIDSLPTDGTWMVLTMEYTADGTENYLTIGNLKSDKETEASLIEDHNTREHKKLYNHAYLLIDEVSLALKTANIYYDTLNIDARD